METRLDFKKEYNYYMKKLFIMLAIVSFISPLNTYASLNQSKELDEVDRRIASSTQNLQRQIDDLNYKLLQLKNTPAQTTIVQNVIVDEDTKAKVQVLETKVGILEKAVIFIQENIMRAINTAIDLLERILNR